MMPQLRDGDYVPNTQGGFVRLEDNQALLMRALYRLQCRRGAFPLMPELGSRLYELVRVKPASRSAMAKAWCMEALRELPVTVTDVILTEHPDGRLELAVQLKAKNQTLTGEIML